REALESMLPLGDATLISVARHLQVNKDRLKRTLYEHGWTYSRLRMHVQFQLSTHLLIRSDASIDEICERTGFSEISCFYRAFRRWTGDSPGAYRARMR
ncbi:MAG: AraC family transcriptional regulator, partial [Nevskia sp.]|nr:AraC family transcriptional regulator [Nevskia sp.]